MMVLSPHRTSLQSVHCICTCSYNLRSFPKSKRGPGEAVRPLDSPSLFRCFTSSFSLRRPRLWCLLHTAALSLHFNIGRLVYYAFLLTNKNMCIEVLPASACLKISFCSCCEITQQRLSELTSGLMMERMLRWMLQNFPLLVFFFQSTISKIFSS